MIEESYVSFDTAKMLKEAGFDEVCRSAYYATRNSAVMYERNSMLSSGYISRPTQALAARWLREKHKIHVGADMAYSKLVAGKWIYQIRFTDSIGNPYKCVGWFNNYEEALEAGLQEAIKLIKK